MRNRIISKCLGVLVPTIIFGLSSLRADQRWEDRGTILKTGLFATHFSSLPPLFPFQSGTWHEKFSARNQTEPCYRLPGEFEPQDALLLACRELLSRTPQLFAEIVQAAQGNVAIIALVNNMAEHRLALRVLAQQQIPADHVHFAEVSHNTMWTRDYGPMIVKDPRGKLAAIDAQYEVTMRPDDDKVPLWIAERLSCRVMKAALRLEGGNLLSNGQGLCIATRSLLEINLSLGYDEPTIRDALAKYYGGVKTVLLDPLAGEPTGHVDMFATFTSADTVVVGAYDPRVDPENAEILDRNARQLARLRTAQGRLHVVRVPMPSHDDGVWRTYTNVVYANNAVLVPVYSKQDAAQLQLVHSTYSSLLPGRRVIVIDAEEVASWGGALHCLLMNLGPIGPVPEFPTPIRQPDDIADPDVIRPCAGADGSFEDSSNGLHSKDHKTGHR